MYVFFHLSMMVSRSSIVAADSIISFLFMAEQYSIVCMCMSHFFFYPFSWVLVGFLNLEIHVLNFLENYIISLIILFCFLSKIPDYSFLIEPLIFSPIFLLVSPSYSLGGCQFHVHVFLCSFANMYQHLF